MGRVVFLSLSRPARLLHTRLPPNNGRPCAHTHITPTMDAVAVSDLLVDIRAALAEPLPSLVRERERSENKS